MMRHERLKKACQEGCIEAALRYALDSIPIKQKQQFTLDKLAQILFTRDQQDNQSPFQHAADAGRTNMVFLFVAILILARAAAKPKKARHCRIDSWEIMFWLRTIFGFPPYFGSSDMQTCISNSKHVRVQTASWWLYNYTLQQMADTCQKYGQLRPLLQKSKIHDILNGAGKQRKKRLPSIVVENEHDFSISVDDGPFDIELHSTTDGYKQIAHENENSDHNSSDNGDSPLEVVPQCITDEDEWSCLTSNSTFDWEDCANKKDASESNSDTWEITSEISSVVSFVGSIPENKSRSYLEIAREGGACEMKKDWADAKEKTPLLKKKEAPHHTLSSIPEEDTLGSNDKLFDAFFVMEGVKDARGGKSTTLFKGNQRTQNQRGFRRKKEKGSGIRKYVP